MILHIFVQDHSIALLHDGPMATITDSTTTPPGAEQLSARAHDARSQTERERRLLGPDHPPPTEVEADSLRGLLTVPLGPFSCNDLAGVARRITP